MSNPLFTFRPTKDKLQPFEKRFSKRETTVRKWTFVRDSESVAETNKRRDSLRSNASTRLSASLSNLKRKSSIPAILEGVNLPSDTPEGSENGSDLNSDLSPYSQTRKNKSANGSDILTHASLRSRTKQKVQVESDDNVSSSSEFKTTGSDQGTITSTLDSNKESYTETFRTSPRKKLKQIDTETISRSPRKKPRQNEDKASKNLQAVRHSIVIDEVSSDSTSPLYRQSKEETLRQSPRKRPFQSVHNSSVNNNSVMSTKISSAKMADVDISEKSLRIELERIDGADESEGGIVVQNDKKVERELASCKKLKTSINEQALSRNTNIDDGRRSSRLHKVSQMNSDQDSPQKSVRNSRLQADSPMKSAEDSPQKSVRRSRLQKVSPMNSDEESPHKSRRRSRLQKVSPMKTDEDSPQKSVRRSRLQKVSPRKSDGDSPQKSLRRSRLESLDSQDQTTDINEKRSSRLTKLDHKNTDNDTLYSTSSEEMVNRQTKVTISRQKEGLKKIETSSDNVIEDSEEISGDNPENVTEENEEISRENVIKDHQRSSRFQQKDISGQNHMSTAVNPVNISYVENWNERKLNELDNDSESDKISKNNSKSINSDISRRQVSTEESEDITEDQHVFSESFEESDGYKSREDIFRTASSDEKSIDSEVRKNTDQDQRTEKQNTSRLSPLSELHTNTGHKENKINETSFQNQQKGNEKNSTLSKSSRSNEKHELSLSENKNSSCQEDVVSMETDINSTEHQMEPKLLDVHEINEEEIGQEEKEFSHHTEGDLVDTDNEGEASGNKEQSSHNHSDHPREIESAHRTEDDLVDTDNEGEVSGNKKQRSHNHGDHPREIESSHLTEDDLVDTANEREVLGNKKQSLHNHCDHPREIESILVHVSSDTPARKKSINAVKKKVRIVADEPESFNEERTVRMWKGNDRNRTKGDLIDLDIVLETITNTIDERRSGCSESLGKKALNSMLVYTRKEITDTINKIEDLKQDKKDLSRSRKDVKMLREKLLQLQMDRTSLMKKIKAKKQTIKPKLNDISQWLTSMTRLMKVTPNTKSPRKVVYTTFGNFPFNI
ncbi:biorientation of chromosomes in cell division protein 1-like 1 isoform X2 [Mytilus californianus]|uniref:biorientation of chromosomes in cell division protein 1-like 1 isoform X2 n=1 Tax=Mytilus californianus TaxID=6549 RepID=UPI0022468B9F|nr:biorientation of chromosomes in cell division protein 1-like 1 isoform X2 [Mytilus californianus]